jgi:tRNA pseudouridine55 synthase
VVVETGGRIPTERELRKLFLSLVGDLPQTPPMYSALKQGGRRLYDLAREGKTVERMPRAMTLYALELVRMTPRNGALISLRCSKGFYVRTLCHEIGVMLGCPAHMRFLLRTASGTFSIDTAKTLEEIGAAASQNGLQSLLVPMEDVLSHLPFAEVPAELMKPFENGVPLPLDAFPAFYGTPQNGRVQLRVEGKTMAIAKVQEDLLKPATWLR